MKKGFIFSKRLLYTALFGVALITWALYISQTKINDQNTVQSVQEPNKALEETIIITEPTEHKDLPAKPLLVDKEEAAVELPLTETDILTRNIIGQYVQKTNDNSYTKAYGKSIVQNATKEMFTLNYTPVVKNKILLSANTTKDFIINYKKELHIAIEPIILLPEYELNIYARAIQNNSEADFNTIGKIADIYTNAGDTVLLITAPNNISDTHLDIVNSLYRFAAVLRVLSKGYDDPAASLSGTGNFTDAEESIQEAFSKLKIYFILNDVDKIII